MSGILKVELTEDGENQDEAPFPQLEPLIMPEIVGVLVKFIGTEDMNKCRFVSKLWNKEIIKQMKYRSTFSFTTHQDIEDFLTNGQEFFGFRNFKLNFGTWVSGTWVSGIECETKELYSLSSHCKLLQRVELDFGSFIPSPSSFTLKIFREVCLLFLQKLECLKLTKFPCLWINEPLFLTGQREIIFQDLRTIDINVNKRDNSHHQNQGRLVNGIFYTQLLRLSPNLQELHLSRSEGGWGSMCGCFEALLSISPPNLKRLYINCQLPNQFVRRLANSTMNLQKLVIDQLGLFSLNFESDVAGNQINIDEERLQDSDSDSDSEEDQSLCSCDNGISCTQLLQTFISAFQAREEFEMVIHLRGIPDYTTYWNRFWGD